MSLDRPQRCPSRTRERVRANLLMTANEKPAEMKAVMGAVYSCACMEEERVQGPVARADG